MLSLFSDKRTRKLCKTVITNVSPSAIKYDRMSGETGSPNSMFLVIIVPAAIPITHPLRQMTAISRITSFTILLYEAPQAELMASSPLLFIKNSFKIPTYPTAIIKMRTTATFPKYPGINERYSTKYSFSYCWFEK